MSNTSHSALLPCDGCGQLADSAHISHRLERLAWSTRYRPLHIQALLLGGIAPQLDADFLYSPSFEFSGEGGALLQALEIETEGKSAEGVQVELQKLGILVSHVLECPLEASVSALQAQGLIEQQLPATIARIRRSLKPKRVLLLSAELLTHAPRFHQANLSCLVLPPVSGVFLSPEAWSDAERLAFRDGLGMASSHGGS